VNLRRKLKNLKKEIPLTIQTFKLFIQYTGIHGKLY